MINLDDYSRKPLYKDIQLLEINYKGKFWYLNGKRHRKNGPASEWAYGDRYWWFNGKRHREDGPAVERANGYKEWRINGQHLTEQEFNQRTTND